MTDTEQLDSFNRLVLELDERAGAAARAHAELLVRLKPVLDAFGNDMLVSGAIALAVHGSSVLAEQQRKLSARMQEIRGAYLAAKAAPTVQSQAPERERTQRPLSPARQRVRH